VSISRDTTVRTDDSDHAVYSLRTYTSSVVFQFRRGTKRISSIRILGATLLLHHQHTTGGHCRNRFYLWFHKINRNSPRCLYSWTAISFGLQTGAGVTFHFGSPGHHIKSKMHIIITIQTIFTINRLADRVCVYWCVCVCVHAPEKKSLKTYHRIPSYKWHPNRFASRGWLRNSSSRGVAAAAAAALAIIYVVYT